MIYAGFAILKPLTYQKIYIILLTFKLLIKNC